MTAHAMTGDRERCLDAGMDAYVSKPLRPDELFAAIEGRLVPAARSRLHAGSSAPELLLDAPNLLARFGGNRKLLREVIDVFLVDSPLLMTAIQQARAGREGEALASSAHALKGSVGLFVQRGAYETARRLEQAGRSGDLTGVDEACAVLEDEISGLRTALGDLRQLLGDAD
jgi:CheY-like chemotaxis protein